MMTGIRRTSTSRGSRARAAHAQQGWVDRNHVQFMRRSCIEAKTLPSRVKKPEGV